MKYFELEMQCCGSLGASVEFAKDSPGTVTKMAYDFESWPADAIIEAVGNFIVTDELKAALVEIKPTGCSFEEVTVTTEQQFNEMYGERILPKFSWLKVLGSAARTDFGYSKTFALVVSDRVLDVIKKFPHEYLEITEFSVQGV